jgi:hypothetical protein
MHQGTTVGLPDMVQSNRLEWTDAPDDSLRFTAPAAGDYVITFKTSDPDFVGGASAEQYADMGNGMLFTEATCPAPGMVNMIDGVFTENQPDYPLKMSAGQSIVIWVSAPSWSKVKAGAYELTITSK